jgi:hypothetical protein
MQEIQEFKAAAAEFSEAAKRLGNVSSTSGIHFHGSAGLSILSILAICVCVMSLGIGAAWYNASMRELATLRSQLETADAIIMTHEKRINKLENPPP